MKIFLLRALSLIFGIGALLFGIFVEYPRMSEAGEISIFGLVMIVLVSVMFLAYAYSGNGNINEYIERQWKQLLGNDT